ncbi:MAG TPA: MerR family transcriptional regulator [bacterium]|nr:MerR family transcriptional regulator [bacterium]
MKEKIITEDEILKQLKIQPELFQQLLKSNLIRPKGTADGSVLIFSAEMIKRIQEIQQFLSMGYSVEEIEKISKKIGLPSKRKQREADTKKIRYLTVGELATLIDMNPRTIKYWEERGIIKPDTRSEGGFRLYAEHWIYLCNLIKDLQLFGYSLEEIKEISDMFRDFLATQSNLKASVTDDSWQRLQIMKERIQLFYKKMEQFKQGIERWEELLKKKEKEIRQLENKIKQLKHDKDSKEKSSEHVEKT